MFSFAISNHRKKAGEKRSSAVETFPEVRAKPGPKPLKPKTVRWEAQLAPELLDRLNNFMRSRILPTTTKGEIIAYLLDLAEKRTTGRADEDYGSRRDEQDRPTIGGKRRCLEVEDQLEPTTSAGGGFEVEQDALDNQLFVVRGGGPPPPHEERSTQVDEYRFYDDDGEGLWADGGGEPEDETEPQPFSLRSGNGQEVSYAAPLLEPG